jgi:filamentous hemagglutinin
VPGVQPGNVDLFAPHGTIDAGIRVSGNVTHAALQILNAGNIQVQGASIGIPTVQGPPMGALTAANNVAGAGQQTALPAQSNTNERPSVIIVEVIGYGGGGDDNIPSDQNDDRRRRKGEQRSYNPTSPYQVIGVGTLTDEQVSGLADEKRVQVRR